MALRDEQLARQALDGSQAAYRELVLRYERPVFNLIARVVRDPALAEDLAQETFVKAFRRLATFDRRRKLSNWLLTIAHNTAIDSLRRTRLDTVPLDTVGAGGGRAADPLTDSVAVTPLEAVERASLVQAVEAAMARLRPEYCEAIVLRYQEDLSYQEISQIMDIPEGTVKTYVHRARKELADHLAAGGWERT